MFETQEKKSAEKAPQPRGSPDVEQVTYFPQLVGGKLVPQHQVLEYWAPAPPQVTAEIRKAAEQKQSHILKFLLPKSQGGINENY